MSFKNFYQCGLLLIVGLAVCSCGGVKHAQMLMFDQINTELSSIDSLPVLQIRTDDILSIQVASRNQESVTSFQQLSEQVGSSGEQALGVQQGYRVDEEGLIYLPFLGAIEARNKSVFELRKLISEQIKDYIPDASVQVRFLNFRVTLLGEINRPNTYRIPNERLTILEAIGMAGDFTAYANRNHVLIVRERGDTRESIRINTQSKDLFLSPYFYLQPNDVIYVEPLKARQYATQGDLINRYSGVLTPLFTLATLVVAILNTRD